MTSESEGEELGVASLTGRKAWLGLLGKVMLLPMGPHCPSLVWEMCPVPCVSVDFSLCSEFSQGLVSTGLSLWLIETLSCCSRHLGKGEEREECEEGEMETDRDSE